MTIRVVVADDQALIRTGFRLILKATPDIRVVAEASDGLQAVREVERTAPDVVLMDVRMPGLDGIEATRRVVRQTDSRVLILTTFDLDEYAFSGLRAGASGFLLKDVMPEALCEAVRAVAAGDAVLTPRITRDFVDRFTDSPAAVPSASETDRLDILTEREREVFGLVATGMSNGEIARHLVLTEATVKTHLGRVLAKLRLRDRVHVVIYAYEHGLT